MRAFHPSINFYQLFGQPTRAGEDKSKLAQLFVTEANQFYGRQATKELLEQIDRRQQAIGSLPNGMFEAKSTDRLAVGLSHGRLWGTGFQFHPVYGFPYLPASGIKGALRHFLADKGESEQRLTQWFGDENTIGLVRLFDAFPSWNSGRMKQRLLAEEIVNKHHPSYYEASADQISPPADYNEPTPVKFVAVAAGVSFRFVFGLEPMAGAADVSLWEISRALEQCLDLAGVGAKTRKGFGRMIRKKK